MVIGESPYRADIESGEPFQSKGGQILTRMLASINIPREKCYLSYVIKCEPESERGDWPDDYWEEMEATGEMPD